jgi:hypothetical protein
MAIEVDLVILTPSASPLRAEVARAVARQAGVKINVHRVLAAPRPEDANRWATIARGRNEGRRIGSSPYVMFLDDDVVLGNNCVAILLEQLRRKPLFGALAADYRREPHDGQRAWHVAMGATLFRRAAVQRIRFRWEPAKCECQCCCDDLRRLGMGIAYESRAIATHLAGNGHQQSRSPSLQSDQGDSGAIAEGRILAAFDRHHFRLFRSRFLRSLRKSGNHELVTAVVYGLYPSERRALSREPRVEVVALPPPHKTSPARRRVWDFQPVIERFSAATPVAYWDAADVVFQASLQPLWELVRANPDKLLAVREPISFSVNRATNEWTASIRDLTARRKALELFAKRPVLNAGLAAGTAHSILTYLRFAAAAWESSALAGSTDWGDQTGLNLFCHTHPECWLEVEEGWNYCLAGRGRREAFWRNDGRIACQQGTPLYVVHGNAKMLPNLLTLEPRF